MKITIYKTTFILMMLLFLASCTSNFEEFNTNPYNVTDVSLSQDFNNVGGYIMQMERCIYLTDAGEQVDQNLTGDAFAQYFVPPTPFRGNTNNVTYFYTWWDQQWTKGYGKAMPVLLKYKKKKVNTEFPQFYAWATILNIFTMQRTTDNYGPIIYSNYGSSATTIDYDSQKDVYNTFFAQLDTAVSILTTFADSSSTSFVNFDLAYSAKGTAEMANWVKVANSLRLRLAIRISNVDPVKAKAEAEKAIAQKYGVIESNDDNFNVSLSGNSHPLKIISFDWGDTRMCATMESVLGGYNDPRLPLFFTSASDATADKTYKGIRQGIDIQAKDTYGGYSPAGAMFKTTTSVQIMTAAEVSFLRAEGALRGWNMGGTNTAKAFYENGISLSFNQYSLKDVDVYLNDATSKFADYVDTHNAVNNFSASSNVTIKWDDTDSKALMLEKIITQKWIAIFPDGQEAWSEFRRTGFPKLIPVVVNYSGGTISTSEFVRRVPFPASEYNVNKDAVTKAAATLTKGDNGGSRVWWDTGSNNL